MKATPTTQIRRKYDDDFKQQALQLVRNGQSARSVASTQNQALASLLFLYKEVLHTTLPWLDEIEYAKRPAKLPVVFSPEEAGAILAHLQGTAWLMASLLYGSGLRLMECCTLRIKDFDFDYH